MLTHAFQAPNALIKQKLNDVASTQDILGIRQQNRKHLCMH